MGYVMQLLVLSDSKSFTITIVAVKLSQYLCNSLVCVLTCINVFLFLL